MIKNFSKFNKNMKKNENIESESTESSETFTSLILNTPIPIPIIHDKKLDLFIKDEYKSSNTVYKVVSPKSVEFSKISNESKMRYEDFMGPFEKDSEEYNKVINFQNTKYPHLEFPFPLDPFQKISIEAVIKGESVLVAAHTSSGKTAVAEYAIALALKENKRVIYTSPIKALSNQKYRDLNERFAGFSRINPISEKGNECINESSNSEDEIEENIGLLTGDTTLNPTANCLVMTTEILRSMLYKQNDALKEVKYIVFDEVHYMRDKERGVVWEESIALVNLHKNLNKEEEIVCIFLSATIPNAVSFARWVSHIHHMNCHVVYTDKRPTPLTHYVVPAGGEGMYKVKGGSEEPSNHSAKRGNNKNITKTGDEENSIKENINHNESHDFSSKALITAIKSIQHTKFSPVTISSTITSLSSQNLLPCIVFSFRRKDCEQLAGKVKDQDLLTDSEKETVDVIFENATSTLSEDDRSLAIVRDILPLLKRGIGIHHSGLVPIIREIVEILFTENLIKLLFATETFAIGLNVPAKSCLFTSLRKFDGTKMRLVSVSEYMQMSGRAGRRGIDKTGTCVSIINDLTYKEGVDLFNGSPDILCSEFNLSYNSVLSVSSKKDFRATEMLERTFFHFQNVEKQEILRDKLKHLSLEMEGHDEILEGAINSTDLDFNGTESANRSYNKMLQIELIDVIDINNNSPYLSVIKELPNIDNEKINIIKNNAIKKPYIFIRTLLLLYSNLKPLDMGSFKLAKGTIVDILLPINGNPILLKNCYIEIVSPSEIEVVFKMGDKLLRKSFGKNLIQRVYLGSYKKTKSCFTEKIPVFRERFNGESEGEFNEIATLCAEELEIFTNIMSKYKGRCMLCEEEYKLECLEDECTEFKNISDNIFIKNGEKLEKNMDYIISNFHKIFTLALKFYINYLSTNKKLSSTIEISFLSQFNKMSNQLINLNYMRSTSLGSINSILENSLIEIKGKVACEITNGNELMLTEMLFNGTFKNMGVVDVTSLLSCFVCDERDEVDLSEASKKLFETVENNLKELYRKLNLDIKTNINFVTEDENLDKTKKLKVKTQKLQNIEINVYDSLNKKYSKTLMDPIRLWTAGKTFDSVLATTPVFEGALIRVLKRLEEVLRQMGNAARVMGSLEFENLFADSIGAIKRGIVFANSLYL